MDATPLRPLGQLTTACRPGLFIRFVEHWRAPSIRDLDAATLKDIGICNEVRAQAELRDAYRQWFSPGRWHNW